MVTRSGFEPAGGSVVTVGHGTRSADELVSLLSGAGVELVADVRRYPGSRRHPQFGRPAMERWLADAGLGYSWLPALGGRRAPSASSPNSALRNAQFRAYADHMASAEFAAGLDELLAAAADRRTAVMCAESLWWRCHRRLIADHLVLVEGMAVEHLWPEGRLVAHHPSPEARQGPGGLVYDRPDGHHAEQDELPVRFSDQGDG